MIYNLDKNGNQLDISAVMLKMENNQELYSVIARIRKNEREGKNNGRKIEGIENLDSVKAS